MAWITPKTNWKNTDKFAYTDYNRIRNNLLYINDVLNEKYPDKAQTLDLGNPLVYSSNYLPSQFNAFEDALESFTRIGSNVNIGSKKTFKGNDAFIGFQELNRIEECCLRWYNYDPVIHVDSISISPASQTINVGDTATFTVTCLPADAEDINDWRVNSNRPSILTVTKNGTSVIATAIGAGNATINVSVGNLSATASITIQNVVVTQIIPEKTNIEITYWSNYYLGVTLLPNNAINVNNWKAFSDNSRAISVVHAYYQEGKLLLFANKPNSQAVVTIECGNVKTFVNVHSNNKAAWIWVSNKRGSSSHYAGCGIWADSRTYTFYVITDPVDADDRNNFTYTIENPQCVNITWNEDAFTIRGVSVGRSTLTLSLNGKSCSFYIDVR